MIDEKRYAAWFRKEDTLSPDEMYSALDEKFTCARCGRGDLPLALMPHHDKSCRFECGHLIDGPALDIVEEKNQKIEDLEERIRLLESSCRDGLRTIQWFESILGAASPPITYTFRDVARMKNSISKTIGDSHLAHEPQVPKDQCKWCNPILSE